MATGKITDLTSLPTANRATNVLEVVDVGGNASYKATPNFILGLSGNPVGDTDSQTLTNKTLTGPTISGPVLSGTVTGTYTLGGTPTFPASVVTLTGSQTLTNKVLTSPTLSSPTLTNASITQDAVTGFTTSNSGTVYGIGVTAGIISTNSVVPNNSLSNTGTFGSAWAWTSYSPTTTVTGATLGNATTTGSYQQIGKTVTFRALFTVGSTTNFAGLSNIIITTPTTMAASFANTSTVFGSGAALISSSYYALACLYNSSTSVRPLSFVVTTTGRYVDITSAAPAGWAVGSTLFITGTYETA